MRTVIIGNGGAAVESIIALRGGGYNSEIHLFSDSVYPAFNPTLLTYYIAGKVGLEDIFHRFDDFYDRHNIKLHLGSKVAGLDASGKTVQNAAGVSMDYENCIICSGASPVVPGEYQDKGAYTIRSVSEAIALKQEVSAGKKALVAGASVAGIKVVEALCEQGLEVTLADIQPHMFPLSAHVSCAKLIERGLEDKGVRLCLGAAGLDLSQFDIIVVCAGIRPNIDFIDKRQVDTDSGILVDEYMRTNSDGLYAAGDCARIKGSAPGFIMPGLWASARYMGRTAGINAAGGNTACPVVPQHNTSRFFGVDFASIGDVNAGDDVFEMQSGSKYCIITWKDSRLAGMNLLNMPEISGILKSHMQKCSELSSIVLSKVFSKYPPIRDAFLERGVFDGNE